MLFPTLKTKSKASFLLHKQPRSAEENRFIRQHEKELLKNLAEKQKKAATEKVGPVESKPEKPATKTERKDEDIVKPLPGSSFSSASPLAYVSF